jgi:cytochrome b6-f complex iron-sulfur subunit
VKQGNGKRNGDDAPDRGRRGLLAWLWFVLGGLLLAEMAWIVFSFIRPGKRRKVERLSAEYLVVAGPVDRFEPGSVTAFQQGKFYLVRLADGGFLALYRKCTHLGCTVPWSDEEQRFVCPCHASSFDIVGDVQSPPAPRALDRFGVRIENGIVKVDTRKAIRRASFAPSQVARV